MNKSTRVEEFVQGLESSGMGADFNPFYLAYFQCFNSGHYYEAHDVLEHLWLKDGREGADYAFYKGLIQLAGAFVHLRLQYLHPEHPKHRVRLHPARRLFLLAQSNIVNYGKIHRGLALDLPLGLARGMVLFLEESQCLRNPWDPGSLPRLPMPILRKGSD
jgi:predicted metal-dependent hydrolase